MSLTERQKFAVQLKAQGMSDKEIANRLNVHPQTVRKWWHLAEVKNALDNAVDELASELRKQIINYDERLRQIASESLERIAEVARKAFTKARESEDINEVAKWYIIQARFESVIQTAYLRRFARIGEIKSEAAQIADEALEIIMKGTEEIDDSPTAENLEMAKGHSQVCGRSPVGA